MTNATSTNINRLERELFLEKLITKWWRGWYSLGWKGWIAHKLLESVLKDY